MICKVERIGLRSRRIVGAGLAPALFTPIAPALHPHIAL